MPILVRNILHIFLITIIPGVEVRGALPYAIGVLKMPVWEALLVATLANLCIAPLFYLLEKPVLTIASRWAWFQRYRSRLAIRSKSSLARYGLFIGLALFVAIPLPGTGAYTGCLIAEIARMKKPLAIASISLGVLGACTVVFLASVGVIKGVLAKWF
ncbi:MAG TPA: small multi-drug export protein [Clostridia bacterium]|nr:small multi-drug export protein [Clostridia bacterium]